MTERFKNAFKFAGLAAAGVLIFYAITRLLPSNNFNQNFLVVDGFVTVYGAKIF